MMMRSLAIFGLVFSSCEPVYAQYMSNAEIQKEFATKRPQMMAADPAEVAAREKSLIPIDKFIPADEQRILRKVAPTFKLGATPVLPKAVDLRKWDTPIRNQGQEGLCTAFAGVAAMEQLAKDVGVDYSERDAWNMYQQYSCAAFVRALSAKKICDEKHWPYQNTRAPYVGCALNRTHGKIRTTYLYNNIDAVKLALSKGLPVYVGMTVPQHMTTCGKTIPANSRPTSSGHALKISGYEDGTVDYGILKNSWGPKCGDKGYQYFAWAYCKQKGVYCQFWSFDGVES